jgi:hypothetical protein
MPNSARRNANGTSVVTEALRLDKKGYAVVPCDGKKPLARGWTERRLTPEELREALVRPHRNIAIVLSLSGLIDVECDSPEAEPSLLTMFGGKLPPTPTWKSLRGLHRLFRRPPGLPERAKIEIDGVEFRIGNKGALSVVPPSMTDNSRRSWVPGLSVYQVEPAELPPAVGDRLRLAGPDRRPDRVAPGAGNPVIDRVLPRLQKVSQTADGWQACCPAHDDQNPSLSVGIGKDGRLLLHCHAGCRFADVIKALGLRPADPAPDPDRARVLLGADEHRVNAEAEAGLAARAEGLYQRGGQLVRVVRTEAPGARVRRPDAAPVIRALPGPILREELSRHVAFVKPGKDGDGEQPAQGPGHVVSAIAARGVWEGFPHLAGIVSHPVLLPNGQVLATPGFHDDSGLLLWLPDGLLVEVGDRPTQADAVAARSVLLDVVADFPFKADTHRAAWLAATLTPLARPAFAGPAPLNLVDGNVAGVGKGLLADVAAITVLGRPFSVAGYTSDREELRKVITTIALEGDEMVLFDNLSGPVGNDVLDRALTATWWKDRILGGNRYYDGPLDICWWATGNNVSLLGDTVRRVMQVRLETDLEHPEERQGFMHPDLRRYVLANRGKLLSAALTILRAYEVAGRPAVSIRPWGSFESWSDLVRAAVIWCGLPDPGNTRDEMRRVADPDLQAISALLAGIRHLDPTSQGLTTADIVSGSQYYGTNQALECLWEALVFLCSVRGDRPSTVSLGKRLHNLRGRVVNGLRLEQLECRDHKIGTRWIVVDAKAGGEGELGEGV